MEVLVFLRDTRLHKKLTQLMLALNSFWLVRNRLLDFESCAIIPTNLRAPTFWSVCGLL